MAVNWQCFALTMQIYLWYNGHAQNCMPNEILRKARPYQGVPFFPWAIPDLCSGIALISFEPKVTRRSALETRTPCIHPAL